MLALTEDIKSSDNYLIRTAVQRLCAMHIPMVNEGVGYGCARLISCAKLVLRVWTL